MWRPVGKIAVWEKVCAIVKDFLAVGVGCEMNVS